jgi:hypothetical protein
MSVQTKAQNKSDINSLFADNTTGDITASDLRTITTNIVDSYPDILIATGELTSAQILALHTTPITLIGAGGANTLIRILDIRSNLVFNGTGYTGSGSIDIKFSGTTDYSTRISNKLVTGTADDFNINTITSHVGYLDTPIVASATSAFTIGNSPIKWSIRYTLETIS